MPDLTTPAVPHGSLGGQPDISHENLLLRRWRPADQDAVVDAFADPDIQRWHCRSMTPDEARDWIAGWPGQWQAERGASWAIEVDGQVAGQIGLRGIDLYEGNASISYWVRPAWRGRRIAPTALDALAGWSFGKGLHRLSLSHSTRNLASCRVAERAGFVAEGTRREEGRHADGWHDMHLHGRISP